MMRQYINLFESNYNEEITDWISENISTEDTFFRIDDNNIINVDQSMGRKPSTDVTFFEHNQTFNTMPYKWGVVKGEFVADDIPFTTLYNFPEYVGKTLSIQNTKITTLKGAPQYVGQTLAAAANQNLTSLEGCPETIGINLVLSGCINLSTLKGIKKNSGQALVLKNCPNLSPWEMRYALFCDNMKTFVCDNKNVASIMKDYFKLSIKDRQDTITSVMEDLKKES